MKNDISASISYEVSGVPHHPFRWERVGTDGEVRLAGAFFVEHWPGLIRGDWGHEQSARAIWEDLLAYYIDGTPLPQDYAPGFAEVIPLDFALPLITRDGRRRRRITLKFLSKQIPEDPEWNLAHASLFFGVFAGLVIRCRCGAPVLKDPKHPWVVLCRTCRRQRGRPRAPWLPDQLRAHWTRLVNRVNQQVTQGEIKKTHRRRLLSQARQDAERVAQGEMTAAAWWRKWDQQTRLSRGHLRKEIVERVRRGAGIRSY